jgi:phage/plasmid-like protein (TIGR03299 family)
MSGHITNLREIESQEVLTASECILKHKLGWNVAKKPVYVDGKLAEDFVAIQREDTGTIFQVAGAKYEPIQNVDAFKFFDEITKTGQAKYVQAGSYKGGAVVWLRAKMPCDFEVLPGDKLNTYLKIVTSHDGSHRLTIFPEVYRQVCSNGMHAWVKDASRTVAVKHTEHAGRRFMFKAKEVLTHEIEYFQRFAERCRQLAQSPMTSGEVDRFLERLFAVKEGSEVSTKTENQIGEISRLVRVGTGMDIKGVQGTAWAVYNAVTEYVDKYRPTRGEDENREYSAEFGSGRDLREKAFELLAA